MSDEHDPPAGSLDDCCGEAALHLLGLLDERRERAFMEHARHCAVCGDELDALAPAVERLPVAVQQFSAPERVKREVMARVRQEAQESAATAAASGRVRGRAHSRPRVRDRLVMPGWALGLAGAGVLAAGVAIGGLSHPFNDASGRASEGAGRAIGADVTLTGTSATLHQSGGHTWLTISNMPGPSSGHVYEVWVKYPGRALPQPTDGLFTPTSAGDATVDVPHGAGASEVMVTQEPSGGSPLPTSPPVIVARLS